MDIVILMGQGSTGKSRLARELVRYFSKERTVRLVSMDEIVRNDRLGAEHWQRFEDGVRSAIDSCDMVVIDFWRGRADHVLQELSPEVKAKANLYMVQLFPTDWRVILRNQRHRQCGDPVTGEQERQIRDIWERTEPLPREYADGFGLRSARVVVYRYQAAYLSNTIQLLTEGCGDGEGRAMGSRSDPAT